MADTLWTDDDPKEDGIYVVWLMADEGEGYDPAEWSEVDRWKNGQWEFYGSAIVERSIRSFSNFDEAEAAAKAAYLSRDRSF